MAIAPGSFEGLGGSTNLIPGLSGVTTIGGGTSPLGIGASFAFNALGGLGSGFGFGRGRFRGFTRGAHLINEVLREFHAGSIGTSPKNQIPITKKVNALMKKGFKSEDIKNILRPVVKKAVADNLAFEKLTSRQRAQFKTDILRERKANATTFIEKKAIGKDFIRNFLITQKPPSKQLDTPGFSLRGGRGGGDKIAARRQGIAVVAISQLVPNQALLKLMTGKLQLDVSKIATPIGGFHIGEGKPFNEVFSEAQETAAQETGLVSATTPQPTTATLGGGFDLSSLASSRGTSIRRQSDIPVPRFSSGNLFRTGRF